MKFKKMQKIIFSNEDDAVAEYPDVRWVTGSDGKRSGLTEIDGILHQIVIDVDFDKRTLGEFFSNLWANLWFRRVAVLAPVVAGLVFMVTSSVVNSTVKRVVGNYQAQRALLAHAEPLTADQVHETIDWSRRLRFHVGPYRHTKVASNSPGYPTKARPWAFNRIRVHLAFENLYPGFSDDIKSAANCWKEMGGLPDYVSLEFTENNSEADVLFEVVEQRFFDSQGVSAIGMTSYDEAFPSRGGIEHMSNQALIRVSMDYVYFRNARLSILIHEFGHVFGILDHSSTIASCMWEKDGSGSDIGIHSKNGSVTVSDESVVVWPTQADIATMRWVWLHRKPDKRY